MPSFKADLDVFRHALKDHSLSQVGDSFLQTKITTPVRLSGLTFAPSATLDVRVLHRPEDRDDDGVFGKDDEAHIPYALQSAWLKYTLSVQANGKIGFPPASATASRDVELNDYRIHAATDAAWSSLTDDLSSPRTLLDLDDVRKLQPGEALAMELGGALGASITMSWSDVLSTHLGSIVPELANVPIAVKLKSGLEVSVSAKVTDQFSVIVSRTRDGHFRFAVKKAASRNHAYGIEVSAGIDAGAAPAIDEVLDAIVAAITKTKTSKVIDDLRNTIRKRLAAAAQWKAHTGLSYEYSRIDENTSVADFILLDDSRLAGDYALVLDGDFAKIADALRTDTAARTLVRYLNERSITRKSSFGFSLGIGKWIDVKATDTSTFKQTTRTSLDGFRLVTSRGTRRYEEKNIPQNDFEWIVDLKAEMKEFAQPPSTRDFDYGLSIVATLERGALSEGDLERMLDFGAMWDVCVPDASELEEAIGKKSTIRVQLLFDRDDLLAIADAPLESWAAPLAMAMPYSSTFPERRTFASRRDAYASAFETWLRGASPAIHVRSGLAIVERQGAPGSFAWTVGEGHPQLRQRLDAFVDGVRNLRSLMSAAEDPSSIGDAYQALAQFWSQRLYVAAMGRWLLDRTNATKTLQVELGETTVTA